jgi:hypothetical protein
LRKIFGTKGEWQEAGEDCIMRSLISCTLHQIVLKKVKGKVVPVL